MRSKLAMFFFFALANAPFFANALDLPVVDIAPVIDGDLADHAWENSAVCNLAKSEDNALVNPTTVRICRDKENLYVAFLCKETDMKNRKSAWHNAEERDNAVWQDDCVEILLDPFADGNIVFHFIVNTEGVIYDARNGDITWNSPIFTATSKGKDFWVAEISIPFSSLGYTPNGGETWRGNFCREEKPVNELSSLFPTKQFTDARSFGELNMTGGRPGVRLKSIITKDKPAVLMEAINREEKPLALSCNVAISNGGKTIYEEKITETIKPGETRQLRLPLKFNIGSNSLNLRFVDACKNEVLYTNDIQIDFAELVEMKRVWQVPNPLYSELFSDKPAGLAREGVLGWFSGAEYYKTRLFALQFGLRYVYEEQFRLFGESQALIFTQASTLDNEKLFHMQEFARRHGVKFVLFGNPRGAKGIPVWDGHPFLYDPAAEQHYLEKVKTDLAAHKDIVWGVSFGDEQEGQTLRTGIELFRTMKEEYPYIRQVDGEVKYIYGFGLYGIPESLTDPNPYRWMAYQRWLNAKMTALHEKLYRVIKEANPTLRVVSNDPVAYHNPLDYSSWKGKCDILTHQLYPGGSEHRANFGYITKLVADISGVDEIWPCAHAENYARSFTPEETLELLSQPFRNGATGLHYYLSDTAGARKKQGFMVAEWFGAPDRWQVWEGVRKTIATMPRLSFPKPDFAIFFSNDSYASRPYKKWSYELEYAYLMLGPVARSWFTFIDDYQVERGDVNLSDYKVVYLPYIPYERLPVLEKLETYVRSGGTLVVTDPGAFQFATDASQLDAYRERLLGVKVFSRKTTAQSLNYDKLSLPVMAVKHGVEISEGVKVLATFNTGEPAVIRNPLGEGAVIYFVTEPFSQRTIADSAWHDFVTIFQVSLGLATGHDIWRFQFPQTMITPIPTPEGLCLTGNYLAWRGCKGVSLMNAETGGTYSYAPPPDLISDQGCTSAIPFAEGNLTDRQKAPVAGSAYHGEDKLESWVVRYDKGKPFNIVFDFKELRAVKAVRIFYSGSLPSLGISALADGVQWQKLVSASANREAQAEDVLDRVIEFAPHKCVQLRLEFAPADVPLTLAEIEIWAEDK
jgi:hypothetical protein